MYALNWDFELFQGASVVNTNPAMGEGPGLSLPGPGPE